MKTFRHLALFWAVFMGAVFFTNCTKEEKKAPETPEIAIPEVRPTEDALKVTSPLKSYIFAHQYTEVAGSLVNRIKNRASVLDETVATVILPAEKAATLTDAEYTTLMSILIADGNLVVITPTISQWNTFITSLVKAVDRMMEEKNLPESFTEEMSAIIRSIQAGVTDGNKTYYIHDGDEEHPEEHLCDLVALRGNDLFYLSDMNDADYTTNQYTVTSEDEDGKVTSTETGTEKLDMQYNAYDYGLRADEITTWLNEQPKQQQKVAAMKAKGRSLAGSTRSVNVSDLMSAQTHCYSFEVRTVSMFYSVASATVIFDIWAFNDLDSHRDYYLIHQLVDAKNSALNCGPESEYHWFVRNYAGNKWWGYGGYLSQIQSNNQLRGTNSGQLELRSRTPTSSVGSSTTSTELSFNLGGNVGIGAEGPSAGMSAGVTFGKSWSTSTPDLSIAANSNGSSPQWTYSGPSTYAYFFGSKHGTAPNILRNDCQINNSWIWCQPNPSGSYTLISDVNVQTEILAYRTKGLWWSGSTFFRNDNWHHYEIRLTPPARVAQKWQMFYSSSSSKDVSNYLLNNYPNYWKPALTIFTSSDANTSAVDAYFNKFISVLEADKAVWRGNGHKGSFTFSIKREGQSNIYRSHTLYL